MPPSPTFDWQDPTNVQSWIANRTHGNPLRMEHLAIVLELLATLQPDGQRVLDLGCGDGMVDALLLDRFPAAHVTGVDSSPPMLEAAARRLHDYTGRWSLRQSTMQGLADLDLPDEGFDAVIGVQSIHHLTPEEKQTLFQQVAGLLRPGGLFVLSDRIMLTSAALFPYYLALWNRLQAQHGGPPAPPGYGYAEHLYALQARGDLPDTVEDQVFWLRAAGFAAVDCFNRYLERAIFGGLKGPLVPAPEAADPTAIARLDVAVAAGAGLF
jgi:tRNA (cmo5U34)-methyltransferase